MDREENRDRRREIFHDRCLSTFNHIATMKMTPEIEDIIANPEAIDGRVDEEKTDPSKYTWSKDDECRLNSLTSSAKLLQPPRWPWSAPEGTTQSRFNHKQMNNVVKDELQYSLLKCPACGVTAVLVGKDQQGAEQCLDCLAMRRKKQQTQDKFSEAWNKVRPKDEVPTKINDGAQ